MARLYNEPFDQPQRRNALRLYIVPSALGTGNLLLGRVIFFTLTIYFMPYRFAAAHSLLRRKPNPRREHTPTAIISPGRCPGLPSHTDLRPAHDSNV